MGDARPRLGVLGGSFDPPHIGHLAIASEACGRLDLERVLFMPAAAPPHKETEGLTAAAVRLQMAELAVADDLRLGVSGLEIERDLVYTSDSLVAVAERFVGRDLVFIMGSDSLLQFGTWHQPHEILERCVLAVAPRPYDDPGALAAAVASLPAGRVELLDGPLIGVSSSEVRTRVATGAPIRYLVPRAVEEFIHERGLYRSP